ncbi:MAG: DNA double-strand break repair nuclease NurA [Acidobacteria bacterium]|jgi:hypothetical protein|nr:DNA double-strand break repair nuclease NurA [Acidobacteriota bacterium]
MLFRELLTSELHSQRADFQRFSATQSSDLKAYLEKLQKLVQTPSGKVWEDLRDTDDTGALPSAELDMAQSFSFSFAEKWQNHEEARRWAFLILQNRTTFAADGSQLYAEKETSLPVAAIQIGWFENPHDENQGYEKNAKFSVLSPEKLLSQDEPVIPETKVGQLRFEAEVEKVEEFLQKKSGWQARGERMPLAFYDGTLLLSTPHPKTGLQISFTNKLVELARFSIAAKVPLVGFVDRSYARDLLSLLDNFETGANSGERTLYDATILHAETSNFPQVLKFWGDRTCFCYSKRRGLNAFIDAESDKSIVGFTYLQTTSDSAPARLDIPSWVYEAGLLDEVLDVVRAECVIGLGYPYALETADQTAVITMRDREVFLGALQDFAAREKLNFSVSRKSASKGRRR